MTQPEIADLINDIGNWAVGLIILYQFCKAIRSAFGVK